MHCWELSKKGVLTLIGATTENPSFEVNSALLSRCQVYVLKPLGKDELKELMQYCPEKRYCFEKTKYRIKRNRSTY